MDKAIEINGQPLSPGKYSVWMHLAESGPWTLRLNSDARLYHDSPVPEDRHVFELPVTPEQGPHMEALAWYFPVVGPQEATLRMQLGHHLRAADHHHPSVRVDPPGGRSPCAIRRILRRRGSGSHDRRTHEFPITIVDQDGELQGRWGRVPVALIPVAENEFQVGFMRNGALFDVGDK